VLARTVPAVPAANSSATVAELEVLLRLCGALHNRKQMDGLAALVQEALRKSPFSGAIYVFRPKRTNRVKMPWAYAKRPPEPTSTWGGRAAYDGATSSTAGSHGGRAE
jgi:hypothetical protein